jgi:hypothetical protein
MNALILGALALAVVAAPAAQARPAASNPHLEKAERLHAQLRYAEVAHELELAMAVPGNTKAQQRRIFELQGTVQLIMHNRAAAHAAFTRLLDVDPEFQFDAGASPKLRAFLEQVRRDHTPRLRVTFEGHPRELWPARGPPSIVVTPTQHGQGRLAVALRLRARPRDPFAELPMTAQPDGSYRATLEPALVEAADAGPIEYYVLARDPQGQVVGAAGGEQRPFVLDQTRAAVAEDAPWYAQWWLWTAVGVVAGTAAAITTVVLVVSNQPSEQGSESLGTHTLE